MEICFVYTSKYQSMIHVASRVLCICRSQSAVVIDSFITGHSLCDHCLLVHTDLTVTTDRLMDLFQSVEHPDRTGPLERSIGERLGLPESAIDEIKSSYQSAARRKEAYLDTYANQHPWPSWRTVVGVLQLCVLPRQSNDVENTHVQGEQVNDCSLIEIDDCIMTLYSDLGHDLVELRHTCTHHTYMYAYMYESL